MRKGCAKTGFVLFVLCLLLMFGTSLFAQQKPLPITHRSEAFVVSPPLRELAKMPVLLSHGSGQSLSAPIFPEILSHL
jgi:hypothetical protein